jgi:hypothetical protein
MIPAQPSADLQLAKDQPVVALPFAQCIDERAVRTWPI